MRTIKGARRRLAGWIYPGQIPQPRKRRPPAPDGPVSAVSVSYRDAVKFFDRRLPTYKRLASVVADHLDPNGVLVDVGANIGYFTKVVGEVTGFRGTAHLFEPLPHLAGLCRETASRLPFSAPVHDFGLGDEDATMELFVAADGNLGWNTLVADRAGPGMRPVKIKVRRFATRMIGDVVPSFVKIDVEGAEHHVLNGMLPALEQWAPKPPIMCEIGWGQGHPQWEAELAVFEKLAALGYEPVSLDGDKVQLGELSRTTDVLFLPR